MEPHQLSPLPSLPVQRARRGWEGEPHPPGHPERERSVPGEPHRRRPPLAAPRRSATASADVDRWSCRSERGTPRGEAPATWRKKAKGLGGESKMCWDANTKLCILCGELLDLASYTLTCSY